MVINGIFQSVWEDGSAIETPATLDTISGEITATFSEDDSYHGSLEQELFISSDGEVYEVCMECHEHILITEMRCYDGTNLVEVRLCKHCMSED